MVFIEQMLRGSQHLFTSSCLDCEENAWTIMKVTEPRSLVVNANQLATVNGSEVQGLSLSYWGEFANIPNICGSNHQFALKVVMA